MSNLDGTIWSRCSIALRCPTRSHFQRTQSKKRWARVWMNVTVHQEKKKKRRRRAREGQEKRKQATDFKEAVCCPSAVVQGSA